MFTSTHSAGPNANAHAPYYGVNYSNFTSHQPDQYSADPTQQQQQPQQQHYQQHYQQPQHLQHQQPQPHLQFQQNQTQRQIPQHHSLHAYMMPQPTRQQSHPNDAAPPTPPARPLSRHLAQNPAAQFSGVLNEPLLQSLLSNPNLDEVAQRMWMALRPAVSHQEQCLVVLTPNGVLMWLSAYEQQVLLQNVRSEAEIDTALQQFVEAGQVDNLSSQLWWQLSLRTDAVAEDPSLASLSPVHVVSHGQTCLARSTLLLLGSDSRLVLAVLTPVDRPDSAFCYESARQSAVQYNTEWNDYLASCRNEQYDQPQDHHAGQPTPPILSQHPLQQNQQQHQQHQQQQQHLNQFQQLQQQQQQAMQMHRQQQQHQGKQDFFPIAQKPDLAYYYRIMSKQEEHHASPAPELLAKLVVDDHVFDPDRHSMDSSSQQQLGIPGQYASKGLTGVVVNPGARNLGGDPNSALSSAGNQNQSGPKVVGDKKCLECGVEKSPEWRKGPAGPKTLCNACGLRYAKRLRGN